MLTKAKEIAVNGLVRDYDKRMIFDLNALQCGVNEPGRYSIARQ